MTETDPWLEARDALAILGVRPQTLYANVSRGRLRTKPDPTDSRRRLYNAEDVRRLAARGRGGRKAEDVAAETIAWGEPILATSLSTVAAGRLWYRGRDAAALAENADLETVADLLWRTEGTRFPAGEAGPDAAPDVEVPAPLARGYRVLAAQAGTAAPAAGRAPTVLCAEGARAVGALIDALAGGAAAKDASAHARLAGAWGRPDAADTVRRILVLLADHELNASTFAARVAASTGAAPSAALLAGLATLSGPRHGGGPARLAALARRAADAGAEPAVREWLETGQELPGFGHALYPAGDVRAQALLADRTLPASYAALAEVGEALTGQPPNVDFALAALAAVNDLPAEAPLVLFAAARSVGWLAHALEQYATGHLIRPRARYVGPAVGGGPTD